MTLAVLILSGLTGLSQAAPVLSEAVEVPSLSPDTVVHPLLLGQLSEPDSPISQEIGVQTAGLEELASAGSLTDQTAGAYLTAAAAKGPLSRVAAGILARAATDPEAAERLSEAAGFRPAFPRGPLAPAPGSRAPDEALSRLAESARSQPDVAYYFDGRGWLPSLELQYMTVEGDRLTRGGKALNPLGAGNHGTVYVHPTIQGAVIKMTHDHFDPIYAPTLEPGFVADHDEAVTRRLAGAGLGPRLFGRAKIGGRHLAVKEQVYGRTVQDYIYRKEYGPEQHAMTLDLLDRMADARVRVGDMNPEDMMLGRTLLDPRTAAFHVDGGKVLAVSPEESRDALRTSLYNQTALIQWFVNRDIGVLEAHTPLSVMLERGLASTAAKARSRARWARFRELATQLFEPLGRIR